MSVKHLEDYLEGRFNTWARITGKGDIITVADIDDAKAQDIFANLSGDLSPENLHMDGEASMAQVRRNSKLYHGAGAALLKMGFVDRNKFSEFA